MADERTTNDERGAGAAAGAQVGVQGRRADAAAQGGGPQSDQLSGETQKGAQNREAENSNPQGSRPDRNQSAREEDNKL